MARSRNIKPGLFKNEVLGEADPILTVLFVGLWCLADREGRLEDRPKRIKAEIMPYRECPNFNGYLTELASLGFIHRYEVDGVAYIQVLNFKKHQAPHKTEKPSDIPEPPEESDSCPVTVKAPLSNGTDHVKESLIPDSLIPDSLIPDSLIPDSGSPKHCAEQNLVVPPAKASGKKQTSGAETTPVWTAYASAYLERYGTEPVRNAKVNGQLKQFIQRIPADEAPAVAAFYVMHANHWYQQKGHAVDCMLKDAESLRTQWATNRQLTATGARQAERTSHNASVVNEFIAQERIANGKH